MKSTTRTYIHTLVNALARISLTLLMFGVLATIFAVTAGPEMIIAAYAGLLLTAPLLLWLKVEPGRWDRALLGLFILWCSYQLFHHLGIGLIDLGTLTGDIIISESGEFIIREISGQQIFLSAVVFMAAIWLVTRGVDLLAAAPTPKWWQYGFIIAFCFVWSFGLLFKVLEWAGGNTLLAGATILFALYNLGRINLNPLFDISGGEIATYPEAWPGEKDYEE